jgi:hypothetical protein
MLPAPMATIERITAGERRVRARQRKGAKNEHGSPMPVTKGDPSGAHGDQHGES